MIKRVKKELAKVQRRMALRVSMAYCTVSTEAVQMITDISPIELMVQERETQYKSKKQEIWDNDQNREEPREELRTSLEQ